MVMRQDLTWVAAICDRKGPPFQYEAAKQLASEGEVDSYYE
jgi:hypothetical protein